MRIGLVGKMGAGKSTVAARLVEHHGFTRLAFADPVKDASVAAINAALVSIGLEPTMTRAILERDKAALRGLPQWIGTEFGRQYLGPESIWIDLLLRRVNEAEYLARLGGDEGRLVVDDCRFPNEAAALKAVGFWIIRVVRSKDCRIASIEAAIRSSNPGLDEAALASKMAAAMAHPSETEIDRVPFHLTIQNRQTIDDLHHRSVTWLIDSLSDMEREPLWPVG